MLFAWLGFSEDGIQLRTLKPINISNIASINGKTLLLMVSSKKHMASKTMAVIINKVDTIDKINEVIFFITDNIIFESSVILFLAIDISLDKRPNLALSGFINMVGLSISTDSDSCSTSTGLPCFV
jgi:uncharacterized membrane protein YwaF